MAGRAATAVKSRTKSSPRSTTKKPIKKVTAASVATKESVEAVEKPIRTRRKAKPETRTRIYWAVFNQSLKRVAVFEFDQKPEAEKIF